MAPDYISRCVEAIEQDAERALCFTNANCIDIKGDLIQQVDLPNPGASEIPSERFGGTLLGLCDPICGLMKVEFLKQTRLHGAYADSDRVLLAEMALRGRFRHISDFLFYRRRHPLRTTVRYSDHWDRTLVFDPSKAGKLICPWVREVFDFIVTIRRTPICWKDRYKCCKYLYWWYCAHHKFLHQDLLRGLKWITNRMMMCPTIIKPFDDDGRAFGDGSHRSERAQLVRAIDFVDVVADAIDYQQQDFGREGVSAPPTDQHGDNVELRSDTTSL